jgi:hypothetical protein
VAKIRLVHSIVWIDSALAPSEASPRLSLIYLPLFPHSRLVCQCAIVLPLQTGAHSPVSLSPHIASPFMPHSYALYPMTHPFCSLYAIGPCPPVTHDVTWSVPVYTDKVHSLYSLVLISQDFLFSCLPLCDTFSWIILRLTSLVPSTLSPVISHCQVLATGLDWSSASPLYSIGP